MGAPDGLMTKQQVADRLQVSLRTVSRLKIARSYIGRLPRYAPAAVEDYLAANTRSPQQKRAAPRAAPSRVYLGPTDVEARIEAMKKRLLRGVK